MKRLGICNLMVVTGLSGACLAAPALAADLPQPGADVGGYESVPQERFYWTGFYFGGNVGAAVAKRDASGAATGAFDTTRTGVIGGVQAGYNHMFSPNLLIGLEADFSFADLDKRASPNGIPVRASTDWISTLRARAGWSFDRFLVYGTGGLALADVEWRSAGVSDSTTVVGWTVGAGVEGAVTDRVTARLEYLYTDFGSERFNLGGGTTLSSDLDAHIARLGLNYKF